MYTFEVIPIIPGATGANTKHLKSNLEKIDIDNSAYVTRKCQMKSLLGDNESGEIRKETVITFSE